MMKKIDLHIHTISVTSKDAPCEFDIEKFKEYIDNLSLDIVAITNHNHFDLEQFNYITSELPNTTVLPGIEINLENGHMLLIGDLEKLDDFDKKCSNISEEFNINKKISLEKLKDIWEDLNEYLLIPHYRKHRQVEQSIIESLHEYIDAGEVASPKKFYTAIKETNALTPVLFSDARISKKLDWKKYQGRQTYIKTNVEPISIKVLKTLLQDNSKVLLSKTERTEFFQVLSNGQELYNGLNVVLGERSSGKTFFLNQLSEIYDIDKKSVKYIKQFDLQKEDEEKFNEILENEKSRIRESYLSEFKAVVEDVVDVNKGDTNHKLNKYIKSLLEYAKNEKLHDEFSKAKLYTETPFIMREDIDIEELLISVRCLQASKQYKDIINRYILEENLNNLFLKLTELYKENLIRNLKKDWINNLIEEIRQQLQSQTSSPNIEYNNLDFYKIKIEQERIRKFNVIANSLKKEKVIDENKSFGKFTIQALASSYNGALELSKECKRRVRFSSAYKKYSVPIEFLDELKNLEALEKSELYKYFCKVTYQVLNEYDKKVSGGERSEFNLLKILQDARQYQILLIDEPESSFDNLFLKDSVNKMIKEISKELPVVVITHNNTVGILMEPDYILYMQRDIVNGQDEYYIYSGSLSDKAFKTVDGNREIEGRKILLDTLEAGEEAYKYRDKLYNNLK